jgi:hypothetical protein
MGLLLIPTDDDIFRMKHGGSWLRLTYRLDFSAFFENRRFIPKDTMAFFSGFRRVNKT